MAKKTSYFDEPMWDVVFKDNVEKDCHLIKALNWYKINATEADKKNWTLDFLKTKLSKDDLVIIKSLKDFYIKYGELSRNDVGLDVGVISRLLTLGAPLVPSLVDRYDRGIALLIRREKTEKKNISDNTEIQPSIQDKMKDVASKILGMFESEIDGLIFDQKPIDIKNWLEKNQVKVSYFNKITEITKTYIKEFESVQKDRTGYEYLTPKRLTTIIKNLEEIITNIQDISVVKKASGIKPRKRKIKSPIEIVKKLTSKSKDEKLGITSIQPSKIVGSYKLIVFNTKTNVMTLFETDSKDGLTVKGTSIIGYDTKYSYSKKIRKIDDFMNLFKTNKGIRAVKNHLDDIKCKKKPAKNRINSDTLLLGVF